MWWLDAVSGFWNGLSAWIVLGVHVFGVWESHSLYDATRSGNWYDFGFLLGAGSPIFGALSARRQRARAK